MASKKNYTFRFDPVMIDQLDILAAQQRRSRTNMLEVIIEDFLKKNNHQDQAEKMNK
ncbi:MAG: hypothetical protein K9L68_07415 [Spirochaetales bacterium]|nr:hypothetical protein [Spirochaetales bacterium]MCF7938410.1 hypothetical protein [Spirochaetales bacterium]